MANRIIIRIEVTQGAKDKISALSERAGMTQISLMSRLVEWLAAQPEMVQIAILGRYPAEVEGEVAELILKKMMEKGSKKR